MDTQYQTCEITDALTSSEITDDGRRPLRCDEPLRMPKQRLVTEDTCAFQFKVRSKVKPKFMASETGKSE